MEHLKNYVKHDGKNYYISTCLTLDRQYETMVFRCDDEKRVTDWNDLYCEHYDCEKDASDGHNWAVEHDAEIVHYSAVEEHVDEPELPLKNEQKPEGEKTVTITSKQLQEALAEAFAKECDKFFKDDKLKGLLFGATFGAVICAHVVGKFFGEEEEEKENN